MKCNYNGCSSKCKSDIDVESCNVLRAYNQGAKEFAEWLANGCAFMRRLGEDDMHTVEELIAEWQEGKVNE